MKYGGGCIAHFTEEIEIHLKKSEWEILYSGTTYNNNFIEGEIPRPLIEEYSSTLRITNILGLKSEYVGEIEHTGVISGLITVYYYEADSIKEKKISFLAPSNCPQEFSKVYDFLLGLKYFAVGSLSAMESNNPLIQKEAVYIIGDAFGQREIRKEVLRAHTDNKNKKELLKVILDLKKQDIDSLAKDWRTNSQSLEYILYTAYSNVVEMEK